MANPAGPTEHVVMWVTKWAFKENIGVFRTAGYSDGQTFEFYSGGERQTLHVGRDAFARAVEAERRVTKMIAGRISSARRQIAKYKRFVPSKMIDEADEI